MQKTEQTANSKFIRKIYLTALLPNVIAVLGGTVNVFFDGIMVGQRLGERGLSAINQSLPVYLVLCTIGSLFASGASFLASIAIGNHNKDESERIFRATLLTTAIISVIFCAFGIAFARPIAHILSTPETYSGVFTYIRITLIGGVFKVLLYVPFFFLRIEGKDKKGAVAMLTMTVLNIILDWLFLFVFNFGIAGAAWASVIATTVSCLMCFLFLFTDNSNFRFGFALYKKEDWKEIVKFGSPMALNNVLSSARIFTLNLILKSIGGSALLSIFAVVNNVNEFSICVQNGVPQTASAMTGIFFGEKDSRSVKSLLNTELFAGSALSLAFGAVVAVLSGKIGYIFGCSVNCRFALSFFALSLIFATATNIMSYYYNVIGEIKVANIVTICRSYIFVVLFCFILRKSTETIWLFYPLAEIATLFISLVFCYFISRRRKLSRFYLLDESFERSGKVISFSIECDDNQICEASEQVRDFCEQNELSSKRTMAVSLAVEEILTIISQKSLFGNGNMDVRVLISGEHGIIRIRSGGRRYNPIEEQDDNIDYMGVKMITKMATKIEYLSALGVNTLIISI